MELGVTERWDAADDRRNVSATRAQDRSTPGAAFASSSLFATAPIALCVIDRRRRFETVNIRMAALLETQPAELEGRFAASLFTDADTILSAYFAKADAGELLGDLDIAWRGNRFQLSFTALVDDERVCGLSVAATNISRRVRAEESLRLSRRRLQRIARQDHLTGLLNRRGLRQSLHRMLREGRAVGKEVALLLIDIDHFKLYNDTFGHPAGDACLMKIAAALDRVGSGDAAVARYGGEEFVLIANGDRIAAACLAERCRQAISELAISNPAAERGQVTVSVGVAVMDPDADEDSIAAQASILLRAADRALYRAKDRGRDCAAVAPAAA